MEMGFKGGNELVKFVLDRKQKKAQIATSKTHYELKTIPWKQLFDRGKETVQEKITDKLDDEKFKQVIKMSMFQRGYTYVDNKSK